MTIEQKKSLMKNRYKVLSENAKDNAGILKKLARQIRNIK